MCRVLFVIPGLGLPIFGFGAMLVIAIFVCTSVAARTAVRLRGTGEIIHDFAIWFFLPGLIGGRLFFVIQFHELFVNPFWDFLKIWDGGLTFYGSVIGALSGMVIFSRLRKIPTLWLADVLAPAICLGILFGRLGCLLNGCCYGDYYDGKLGVSFPPQSLPAMAFVGEAKQTEFGIVVDWHTATVLSVEPNTPAEQSGLLPGDVIKEINDRPINPDDVGEVLRSVSRENIVPRMNNLYRATPFKLTVDRGGKKESFNLTTPVSLPVHPAQIYDSTNALVMFLLLMAMLPFRKHHGVLFGALAIEYAVSRFLIERLRNDEPLIFAGMTISQNISILLLAIGIVVLFLSRRQPANGTIVAPTPMPA